MLPPPGPGEYRWIGYSSLEAPTNGEQPPPLPQPSLTSPHCCSISRPPQWKAPRASQMSNYEMNLFSSPSLQMSLRFIPLLCTYYLFTRRIAWQRRKRKGIKKKSEIILHVYYLIWKTYDSMISCLLPSTLKKKRGGE
jgi:hypothetical protein